MPLASVFKALDRATSSPRRPGDRVCRPAASKAQRGQYRKTNRFHTTMTSAAWGGSEELWAQAALRIRAEGLPVGVSVHAGMAAHPMLRKLDAAGARIRAPARDAFVVAEDLAAFERPRHFPGRTRHDRFAGGDKPALVVFSDGNCMMPVKVLEYCVIAQSALRHHRPYDQRIFRHG